MKKAMLCVIGLVLVSLSTASAAYIYTYEPTPSDLWDLDHNKYYLCEIDDFAIPAGEYITSAVITIDNINNWNTQENHLYINLLSGNDFSSIPFSASGIFTGSDWEGGGNTLNGYDGIFLDEYQDTNGSAREDYRYAFSEAEILALSNYASDGLFGIGFDPDCHFNNDGIALSITTIPEPVTLVLLTLGCVPLLCGRRR